MVKKIGNKNIPDEVFKNIKGFEEIFEDYMANEDSKDFERKEKENIKLGEQFELQRYLELENDRLTSLEIFLSKKIALKKNFSQTEKLIVKQIERKNYLHEILLDEIEKKDSHFLKNIQALFNSHFS